MKEEDAAPPALKVMQDDLLSHSLAPKGRQGNLLHSRDAHALGVRQACEVERLARARITLSASDVRG